MIVCVCVSSTTHSRLTTDGRAKLGNIFLARALAPRLAAQGVTINALHPGGVRSAISRHLPALVYWQARFTQEVLFWTEDEAALTVVGAVVNPHGRTGTYFVPVLREDLGSAQSQNLSLAQAWVAHTEAWLAEHVA